MAALAWEQLGNEPWAALSPAEQSGLCQAATIAVEQNTDWGGNTFLIAVLAIASEQDQ